MLSTLKKILQGYAATPRPAPEPQTPLLVAPAEPIERVYSNLDEQSIIAGYLTSLHIQNGYCVDIAASDGVCMSNTYALYKDGWSGLAVEYNAVNFSTLARNYVDFGRVNLAKCMVTPENVGALLLAHKVPECFEFLNLDIDGYDYFVLEQILKNHRPRLICAEINEKIPPPVKFTVRWNPHYSWAEDHFFGQSISQLHLLAKKHNYALVELHYNNAFLIPSECSPRGSLTPEEAYRTGYLNQSDRQKKFPWNENMEAVLQMPPEEALAFIKKFFAKYDGMYDASI